MIIERFTDAIRPLRYGIEGWTYRHTEQSNQVGSLRNVLKDNPLLIIGNGPSLNVTPLDEFSSVFSIGLNKINLLFPRVKWRPNMIMCSNPLVARQNQGFYAETEIPVYLSWKTRWFLRRINRSKFVYFLESTSSDFSLDVSIRVGLGGTVTYAALQFGYFMGANPVILLGVDHSFALEGPPNKIVISRTEDLSHFDPNYFGNGAMWMLPDLVQSEKAYARARDAFRKDGREVLDATIGGKLRVFPKISIADVRRILQNTSVECGTLRDL